MYSKIIIGLLCLIAYSNASRVIYMIMHGEKPGYGELDKGSRRFWSTTQNIRGEYNNGLGYTGNERAKCVVDVFGTKAPLYRQPKLILYQHYSKQGDYIDSEGRGLHNSRRMYETAALLAKDLGINLDEQKCCGGDPSDMYQYIETLDESISPILIVHQHEQIYNIALKYAKKYGKIFPYSEFPYHSGTIWTLIEGEIVEDWHMGCYFDKPTTDDKLSDAVEKVVLNNYTLDQANGNNSTLSQELVPLITTKVVPASLLTTVTSKVPPFGASTISLTSQTMSTEAITTDSITTATLTTTDETSEITATAETTTEDIESSVITTATISTATIDTTEVNESSVISTATVITTNANESQVITTATITTEAPESSSEITTSTEATTEVAESSVASTTSTEATTEATTEAAESSVASTTSTEATSEATTEAAESSVASTTSTEVTTDATTVISSSTVITTVETPAPESTTEVSTTTEISSSTVITTVETPAPESTTEVSTTTTENTTPTPSYECSEAIIKQGYKCCSDNCVVIYIDNDGEWGAENGEWCGCGKGRDDSCPLSITRHGYRCCSSCSKVYYVDNDGKWGIEKGDWCGIPSHC